MRTHASLALSLTAVIVLGCATTWADGEETLEVCQKVCGCGDLVAYGHRQASNCTTCHVTQCTDTYHYCQAWAGPYNDACGNSHIPCNDLGPCGDTE